MAGIRGAGKVYLAINNSGTYTGYLDMANVASLAIGNTGSDTKTLKSTAPTNYGANIGSATTPGDDTITIKLNAPNRKNLLCAFLGTDSTVNVSGTSVVDENATCVSVGSFAPLAHYPVLASPAPVITTSNGSTTLVAETDYTIDLDNGLVEWLDPGSHTIAGTTYKVDYTYDDSEGYSIAARTRSSINAKLLFCGENLDSNENIRVTALDVDLTPDGDFNLISSDGEFLEFTLKGVMTVPDNETSPYTVRVVT